MAAWPDGKISANVTPDVTELQPALEIVGAVMQTLQTFGGEDSESHLVKHTADYTEAEVVDAIRWLLDKEWIQAGKKGNSTVYSLTDKGRKEDSE